MTRHPRGHVAGFADLLWRLYSGNEAVKHAVTVLAIVAAVAASNWVRGRDADARLDRIVGWQHQMSDRLDAVAKEAR